ncbi:hypothetical protein FHX37_4046 [Haloactinospora alba]|uniref:GatB/YqeY domain-containing protein n=1 Tax=Haloactinospora alba TaxID=405555 RepID=A0A543NA32_9ACTN|nr:GatB/YqeY domain-containing protein [Haloactinospora alba]TQN28686.1 hypothetical protein FHX37_4046 [Haloactinospora alba]
MAELRDRLKTDLTAAMKQRDEVRVRTLRMALSAVSTEEASKGSQELGDDEVVTLLTREVKRRREAAEAFDAGGGGAKAEAERAEADVLAEYLPRQLTDAELTDVVSAAIAETGASGMASMGQVMKVVTPRTTGQADGSRVAAEVRRQLSG